MVVNHLNADSFPVMPNEADPVLVFHRIFENILRKRMGTPEERRLGELPALLIEDSEEAGYSLPAASRAGCLWNRQFRVGSTQRQT